MWDVMLGNTAATLTMNVKPISEDSSLSMGERKGKNNQPNKQANEKQTKKKALKHCSHF